MMVEFEDVCRRLGLSSEENSTTFSQISDGKDERGHSFRFQMSRTPNSKTVDFTRTCTTGFCSLADAFF